MTRHPDEPVALAALFDCWKPKWRAVDGPFLFFHDITPALRAFGFEPSQNGMFYITRMTDAESLAPIGETNHEEWAALCDHRQIKTPEYLRVFRRTHPAHIILAAKSGLFWTVWDKTTPTRPQFHISTAEYIPSA